MATTLEVMNQVLLNIGERKVSSITSPTGQLVYNVLNETIRDIESVHRWDWLYNYVPAISWSNETAFLDNIRTLHDIQVGSSTTGYRNLHFTTPQDFDARPLTSYTGKQDSALWFSYTGDNEVRLNPYPVDSESRSRVRFYVTKALTLTESISDEFPIPERFIPLVLKRASQLMASRHLDDNTSARSFGNEYEMMVQMYRNTERRVSTRQLNMYRRSR